MGATSAEFTALNSSEESLESVRNLRRGLIFLCVALFGLAVTSFVFWSLMVEHPLFRDISRTIFIVLMAGTIYQLITALRPVQAAAAAMRREVSLRQMLIDGIKDYAIIMLDPSGIIVSWSEGAQRIKGYTADEIIGQHFTRFYTQEDLDNGKPQMELRVAAETGRFEDEGLRVKKGGTTFWANVIISVVKNDSGRVLGYTKISRDITERKKTESEIRELNRSLEARYAELDTANKELEAFTYSVAHDLRAPLRHIHGFGKILAEDYGAKLDPEANELVRDIQQGADRMGCLIDDLLNLSQISRREVRFQVTGLRALVDEAIAEQKSEIGQRQIDWQIGDLPFVECDPGLIKQVYSNLIANGLKYSRPRKIAEITIGVEESEDGPVFFVRDNGVGFNMKYADKLFGVFQRLHRREDFEGTGVGLATVQRIIQKHNGRIWADAEIDKGATFYFTIGTRESMPVEEQIAA